jgi:hypothetical protein
MSEQLTNRGEQEPRRQEILEMARGVNDYLEQLGVQAIDLSWKRFATKDEAVEAAINLTNEMEEQGREVMALNQLPIRIIGADVKVTNMRVGQTEEGVMVEINRNDPFVAVGQFGAAPRGMMRSIATEVEEDGRGHFAILHGLFENEKSTDVQLMAKQLPYAHMDITHSVLAPLTTSKFVVPLLEQHEKRSLALLNLAFKFSEDQPNPLQKTLEDMSEAIEIARERPDRYTPFRRVKILRKLGKAAAKYAEDAGSVMDAVKDIIGDGLPLLLEGKVYLGLDSEADMTTVGGKFVDVLPSQEMLDINEPLIVLEDMAQENLIYAPFSRIKKLYF